MDVCNTVHAELLPPGFHILMQSGGVYFQNNLAHLFVPLLEAAWRLSLSGLSMMQCEGLSLPKNLASSSEPLLEAEGRQPLDIH